MKGKRRIARARLAGEPAGVLLAPRLGELGLPDYHRAAQCIGEKGVRKMWSE